MIFLTDILGTPVYDSAGQKIGRVGELATATGETPPRVVLLLLDDGKSQSPRAVPVLDVVSLTPNEIRLSIAGEEIPRFSPDDNCLLLRKDLLDQQIIDVNGRKVVRVNDLFLIERPEDGHVELELSAVDIGLQGALRRLLKGAIPRTLIRKLEAGVKQAVIPWEWVNLVEPDPLRRVRLQISHHVLTKLHPADLADIVEDLAPKERYALFNSLDDETVAEALSEVQPKLRGSILESLGIARAAGIVEEMAPDAAADLLGDLPEETTSELLKDMNREEAAELGELLEFSENSAGGLMTTDYFAIPDAADVKSARDLLRALPELHDNFNTVLLVDDNGGWTGSVPLARLFVSDPGQKLKDLKSEPPLSVPQDASEEEVVELFDKYNLLSLPVVDEQRRLAGVVTVDDIVSVLWKKH